MSDEGKTDCCGTGHAAVATVAGTDTTRKNTLLSVPEMCCLTEFGMVERELRRLAAVRDVTPDFVRKAVRVESDAVSEGDLLAAARRSGLRVEVGTPAGAPSSGTEVSIFVIQKMDCPTEEALITKRLTNEGWVQGLSFNLMQRKLTVQHTSGRQADVASALREVGMDGQLEAAAAWRVL